MNDLKYLEFRKMTLASFCEEEKDVLTGPRTRSKWDGKSKEIAPQFPGGEGGALNNLRHMAEYIETGGSERFIQMALANDEIIIKNKFGEYYGVEVGEDKDTITECAYIPMCVNSMLHGTRQKYTASALIGKSLKDITTPPDADREV